MSAYRLVDNAGVRYLTFPLLDSFNYVVHGFSTRLGGISPAPYDSLNLGFHVGDAQDYVLENRRRICQALDIDFRRLVCGAQVHGNKVEIVTEEHSGRGAKSDRDALPGIDGLITRRPGVPLASFYADCVPLFLLDPVRKVIGLVHAGWKGTAGGIAGQAVKKMTTALQCAPGDCVAVIGPAIGQCCYEVDTRVTSVLERRLANWELFAAAAGKGRWMLDLAGINRELLLRAGLKPENVHAAGLCTACHHELFFSHRASGGKTGRMGAFIMLK